MRRTLIIITLLGVAACAVLGLFRTPIFISAVGAWEPCTCRYEHAETTGLMDTVVLADGTFAIIQFASDSDATALAALDHVGKGLIFGTSDDHRNYGASPFRQCITLHGEISTIRSPGILQGDDFYWFRLKSWTLEAPFDIQVSRDDSDFEDPPLIQSCASLAEAGIKDLVIDGRIIPLGPFLINRP